MFPFTNIEQTSWKNWGIENQFIRKLQNFSDYRQTMETICWWPGSGSWHPRTTAAASGVAQGICSVTLVEEGLLPSGSWLWLAGRFPWRFYTFICPIIRNICLSGTVRAGFKQLYVNTQRIACVVFPLLLRIQGHVFLPAKSKWLPAAKPRVVKQSFISAHSAVQSSASLLPYRT